MKTKEKSNKLPPSPWALYIKLYCNRKGSFETKYYNNLVEATKSWLSLSESEKQQFIKKFKEYEQKYKIQCCDQLKNAKPFMKIKDAERTIIIDSANENLETENNVEDFIPETVALQQTASQIETIDETLRFKEPNPQAPTPNIFQEHYEDVTEAAVDDSNVAPTVLIEPLPPTIKSGHELFCMLNSTNEDNNNAWTTLPQVQKTRYSRAVSIMKKDYISKYKEYLESLTSKELFEYYNKTIF